MLSAMYKLLTMQAIQLWYSAKHTIQLQYSLSSTCKTGKSAALFDFRIRFYVSHYYYFKLLIFMMQKLSNTFVFVFSLLQWVGGKEKNWTFGKIYS